MEMISYIYIYDNANFERKKKILWPYFSLIITSNANSKVTWNSNIWIQNGRTKYWIEPTNVIDDIEGTKDANYSDDKSIMKHIVHIITQTMIGPN